MGYIRHSKLLRDDNVTEPTFIIVLVGLLEKGFCYAKLYF